MIWQIASWACLLIGGVFAVISAIGLIRMPDVFTRMHAASIGDTLALGLMVIGMMLQAGLSIVSIKLTLILLFMFFASPTTTHALAKAALAGGIKPMLHEDRRKKPRKRKTNRSAPLSKVSSSQKLSTKEMKKKGSKSAKKVIRNNKYP